jgi:hypothetical protein
MLQGSSKTKEILFINNGTEEFEISLSCLKESGDLDLCENIEFEQQSFVLPLQTGTNYLVNFKITIPEEFEKGDYFVNLVATDSAGNKKVLTTEINVETFSFITKIFTKITSNKKIGNIGFPYFFIFLFSAFLIGLIFSFSTKKYKIPNAFAVIIGIFCGLLILLLI